MTLPTRRILVRAAAVCLAVTCGLSDKALAADLMTPAQLHALPAQPADHRIAYGSESEQFGELRLPAGAGPHPVVVLVHGGCWRADFATLSGLRPIGDVLKAEGIASWNIEYRRLFQEGGGWPLTYLDVGQAVDHLRALAPEFNLDLGRVVVVGHSAGGHLAMWSGARHRLDASSELHAENPLPVRGVINLAGTMNMRENIDNMHSICMERVVDAMTGGTPAEVPAHYDQASSYALLPLGLPQVLLWGQYEDNVLLPLAEAHARRAAELGDVVRLIVVPGIGHFEIATPQPPSWPILLDAIRALLDGRVPEGDRQDG